MTSRKRADRRIGGLFPQVERDPAERYAVRRNRPWTPAQEAVAVAAVCLSGSADAYARMVPYLLEAIGHDPVYPPGCLPTIKKHQDTCIRALELRIVTHMMGRLHGWAPHRLMGFHRSEECCEPLTWGEKVKILRPYFRRVMDKKVCIGYSELQAMTGRHAGVDLFQYLQKLRGPRFVDVGNRNTPPVVRADNRNRIAEAVTALDGDDAGPLTRELIVRRLRGLLGGLV